MTLETYCDLNLLSNNVREIVISSGEEHYVPVLPQIVSLKKLGISILNDDIKCIVGVDGTSYCRDKGYLIVFPHKGLLKCPWKPIIDATRLKNMLFHLGVLEEGGSEIIFNPLLYPTCIPFLNTLFCIEAFSGKRIESSLVEKKFDEITIDGRWIAYLSDKKLFIRSTKIRELSFFIELRGSPKTYYDEVNGNYVIQCGNSVILVNQFRGLLYIDVEEETYIGSSLEGANAMFLNPYYVYESYVEGVLETNVPWIVFQEPINVSLVNPLRKNMVLDKGFGLEKGLYSLVLTDKFNLGFIHSVLLGLLLRISGINDIVFTGKLVAYNKFLARIYPYKLLIGDYIVEEDGIVFSLFNPRKDSSVMEYYSVFPFREIRVFNSRRIRGYTPVLLKPNIARIVFGPWEIAIVKTVFEKIPVKSLKYMMFLRGGVS